MNGLQIGPRLTPQPPYVYRYPENAGDLLDLEAVTRRECACPPDAADEAAFFYRGNRMTGCTHAPLLLIMADAVLLRWAWEVPGAEEIRE